MESTIIYLFLQERPVQESVWTGSAEKGLLSVIKALNKYSVPGCTPEVMDYAAMNGYTSILSYLFITRQEHCTYKAMNWAAINGHLDTVKWLQTFLPNNCDAREARSLANLNCHKEIVEFLDNNITRKGKTPLNNLIKNKKIKIN